MAGSLAIPAATAVGGAFSPVAGLALAALVAVDPLLVEQGRTARMYPLLALLFLLVIHQAGRIAAGRTRAPAASLGLGLALGAAIWTHALGVVLWLAVLAVLPLVPGARGRLGGALAIALVLAIPGAIALLGGGFSPRGSPAGPGEVVGQWLPVGRAAFGIVGPGIPGVLLSIAGFAGLGLFVRRAPPSGILLLAASALSILAVLPAAAERPYGIDRYLTPVHLAALAGLGALFATALASRWRAVAWGPAALVCAAFLWQALPRGLPADHRIGGVARALGARTTGETPVVFRPAYLRHVGAYYGIRPAVEEPDNGRVWIVTQAAGILGPAGRATVPGEVARRLPEALAGRDIDADMGFIADRLAREHALAIVVDDAAVRVLTPGGEELAVPRLGP